MKRQREKEGRDVCMKNKGSLQLIIPIQSFDSYKEVANLIHYITRTGKQIARANELVSYGGHGVSVS